MFDWQLIDTAPRDGRPVLLFVTYGRDKPEWVTAQWLPAGAENGDWELIQSGGYAEDTSVLGRPTHWAALPLGPAGEVWELPAPPPPPMFGPPTSYEAAMNAAMNKIAEGVMERLTADNAFLSDTQWSVEITPDRLLPIRLPNDFTPRTEPPA